MKNEIAIKFTQCPVCDGEMIKKEVEKLLRSDRHSAMVNVQAEVCATENAYICKTARACSALWHMRLLLKRQETTGFQPLEQSFRRPEHSG